MTPPTKKKCLHVDYLWHLQIVQWLFGVLNQCWNYTSIVDIHPNNHYVQLIYGWSWFRSIFKNVTCVTINKYMFFSEREWDFFLRKQSLISVVFFLNRSLPRRLKSGYYTNIWGEIQSSLLIVGSMLSISIYIFYIINLGTPGYSQLDTHQIIQLGWGVDCWCLRFLTRHPLS